MSFLGIVLGIVFFVAFVYMGYNRVLVAILAAAIMFIFSGVPVLAGYTDNFMPAMGAYIRNYTLIFILSALFGKVMTEAGTAKRIALSMSRLVKGINSLKVQKYCCVVFVPLLYFVLSYVGINGMVIAFTIMPIAKDLFIETNTPWRIYTCGGAQSINAAMLAGSLNIVHISAMNATGTPMNSGVSVSLVLVGVYTLTTLIMLGILASKLLKSQEGFLPSGAAIAAAQLDDGVKEEDLPSLILSVIPVAVIIIFSVVLHLNVVIALTSGVLVTFIIGWKNVKNKIKTVIGAGVTAAYAPLLAVGATVGFGASLKALAGYGVLDSAFAMLPPLYNGLAIGFFSAFMTANANTPADAFGGQIIDLIHNQAGLSIATTEKLMCWTACASMAPHNAGYANVEAVMRLPFKQGLRNYTLYTFVPSFFSIAVVLILINLGIIV